MIHSYLKDVHKLDHPTNEDAPELRFMRHICEGGRDVGLFFHEKASDQTEVMLYTPYGRFEGIDGIKKFSEEFLGRVGAISAEVHPVIQTAASGRSVTEAELWFDMGEDEPYKVPMSFFCDLGHGGKMEGLRMYYFYQWIEGTPAYYEPIFRPAHNEPAQINQLSGIMKYYYKELHNEDKEKQLDNLLSMFSDDPRLGGYRSIEMNPLVENTKEVMYKKYSHIVVSIPKDLYIRFEAITDDGRNCMVEWTSVVRKHSASQGVVSQAGMVGYERDEHGKICSVRICDNFKWEHEIDHSMVKPENNFVD